MIHELWVDANGPTFCFAGSRGDAARALLLPDATLTWTVEASSHLAAMRAYYEHMGWDAYTTNFPDAQGQTYVSRGWE